MKIPPKKPHFFKPIHKGFKHGLKIPTGFLKYLKGQKHIGQATLRSKDKKWLVKLNGHRFEDGWGKFAEENDVQLGDMLVFRHEGNMEFEVSIFDSTHCDREYAEYMQILEKETHDIEEISKKLKLKERPRPRIKLSKKASSDIEVAPHHKSFSHSHFECTIKGYSKHCLHLPQQFTYANGLTNKKCGLIIRDERQRSWNLKLIPCKSRTYIGGGWAKFSVDNGLKEGDRVMFEVVTNGETPIWKFQVVTNQEQIPRQKKFQERPRHWIKFPIKASSDVEAAPLHKSFGHSEERPRPRIKLSKKASSDVEAAPHFECTITGYCLSKGYLFLPQQFAYANGLTNKKCSLIIRDERQRSWNLKLISGQTQTFIGGGWSKFRADNCLKKGDRVIFEVVTNGETPIWKFRILNNHEQTPLQKKFQDILKKPSSMSLLNAQVVTSTSSDDGHPCFISTLKPYCFGKGHVLYIPMDFAKSNGLLNRKCEMILRDERERCWLMWIGRLGKHFVLSRGWTKFRAENGLQVGDTFKFELIENGETPIARFHCTSCTR